ncbi:Putative Sepiapterin reductase [Rhizopus microsporus]|nr:Putative Sepiapterin reductase [Rhizopus microsporus]
MLLKHTVYVITGANRGFGKVIAEVIASKAKEKTSIILVGRNRAELETIQLANVDTYFIGNISLEGAIQTEETIVKSLEDMMKDIAPITKAVLINNAGSTGDLSKKVDDYTMEEIQTYIDLNVTSYIALITGFIRLFKNYNSVTMTIVNISSLLAVQAFPNWGLYATGKSARDMLLKVVAKENPTIRTLSYAPGPLNNEMQKNVRETLGDDEQKTLYTKMANEVRIALTIIIITKQILLGPIGFNARFSIKVIQFT